MQITIWSDFVCPFCFIGAKHLDKALENFEHADEVTIEYKSYQLEPGATYVPGRTYKEAMIERKGAAPEQIDQMFSMLIFSYCQIFKHNINPSLVGIK